MKKQRLYPPKIAEWLLEKLLFKACEFGAITDYQEQYQRILKSKGIGRANFWYINQLLLAVPQFIRNSLYWSIILFKNYFKITVRNLRKRKLHSAINIFGLALGLSCCMLIYLFITDEFSYDKFHENSERIFAVVGNDHYMGISGTLGPPIYMATALEEYFHEIEYAVRMHDYQSEAVVRYNNNIFNEKPVFTDPSFFSVFSFSLLRGNPATALLSDNSVILTQGTAKKYYADEDPLGKTLTMEFGGNKKDFIVTGIVKDLPFNSSVRFNILIRVENIGLLKGSDYINNMELFDTRTFVMLRTGVSSKNVDERFPAFVERYFSDLIDKKKEQGKVDGKGRVYSFFLLNIKDIHLRPDIIGNYGVSDLKRSYMLAGIALLILIVSCINYINLSIGRASGRAGEIGIRKVVGARRGQLIQQFLGESIVITYISVITAIFLAIILLPVFNGLAQKQLIISELFSWKTIFGFLLSGILLGTVIGCFPAVVISGFQTVEIIKGKFKISYKNLFTKILVVVQFSLSVFLIILSIVMADQINYMCNRELGFDKDGVVVIETRERDGKRSEAVLVKFKNMIINNVHVKSVSGCLTSFNRKTTYAPQNIDGKMHVIHMNKVYYDYLETLGITLVEGRDFSEEFSDGGAALVNKRFTELMDLKNPLGETITIGEGYFPPLTIIGVIEDYNFISLKNEIEPAVLCLLPDAAIPSLYHILVKVSPDRMQESISILKESWKEIYPDRPFLYSLLEDDVETAYSYQRRWNSIIKYSSLFAILITCLGIFGLTSIILSRRIKEIGIRMVLGARLSQILYLVTREFIILVIFSNLIAWPLAYYIMNKWLQGFAYRINLDFGFFIIAGILTFFITSITVCCQTVKTALNNPVHNLRYE